MGGSLDFKKERHSILLPCAPCNSGFHLMFREGERRGTAESYQAQPVGSPEPGPHSKFSLLLAGAWGTRIIAGAEALPCRAGSDAPVCVPGRCRVRGSSSCRTRVSLWRWGEGLGSWLPGQRPHARPPLSTAGGGLPWAPGGGTVLAASYPSGQGVSNYLHRRTSSFQRFQLIADRSLCELYQPQHTPEDERENQEPRETQTLVSFLLSESTKLHFTNCNRTNLTRGKRHIEVSRCLLSIALPLLLYS